MRLRLPDGEATDERVHVVLVGVEPVSGHEALTGTVEVQQLFDQLPETVGLTSLRSHHRVAHEWHLSPPSYASAIATPAAPS